MQPFKIDIVIASDPDFYPPTINAANILSEKGCRVNLIGIKYPDVRGQRLHQEVNRINIGSHKTGISNFVQYVYWYFWLFRHLKRSKPDWILAYDGMIVGPVALVASILGIKWHWHNHDLFPKLSGWYRILDSIESRFTKVATSVSFPQEDRAELFSKKAGLVETPLIVYNGPRRNWGDTGVPAHSEITDWVEENKFIVLYQGQFSRFFNIDVLIRSFYWLPASTTLCLIGRELESGLIREYQKIIEELGIEKRVRILASLSYDAVPSVTRYCQLGVAKLGMNKNIPFNDYYLTGASNKVSEYLAFSLPVLMADTEVNRKFYNQYGFAVFADGMRSENVADTISKVVDRGALYQSLKTAAEIAGAQVFNFDVQFQKIINLIESKTAGSNRW